MFEHGRRLQRIRATALLLTALSLLVVSLSAYLRLDGAGLGCADWPACYGKVLFSEARETTYGVARLLHRLAATLALLLGCSLLWQCWRRPSIPQAARPASLLLLLMLSLSALGLWSADPRLTLVGFLNIIGGLGLVTFSWRVVLASSHGSPWREMPAPGLVLRLGVLALTLTVMVGALIGATYAAAACTTFPDCGGRWWPSPTWSAIRPFTGPAASPPAGDPGAASLHLLHRYGAFATLLLLAAGILPVLRDELRGKAARLLLILLVSEVMLGSLVVLSAYSLALAVSHGTCAAVVLATVATLLRRQG